MEELESTTVTRVLVTGAAGKTGRAVVRALSTAGFSVRALVRRESQRAALEARGARESAVADMLDGEALADAAQSVDAVYHICPNVHPQELVIGCHAIAAARSAGARRFVFHSVLHPIAEKMPHHWAKMRVEEALLESGLDVTVLQPAPYMQNLLGQWPALVEEGVYRVPYGLASRVVMVDLEDVADAAARVLADPAHVGATYPLCGAELLDHHEIAAELSRALGRQVVAEAVATSDWARDARAAGLDAGRVETLAKMFRYYERYGLSGSSATLEWLLGRPPTGLAEFLRREREQSP